MNYKFKVGDKVKHPTFGEGKVSEIHYKFSPPENEEPEGQEVTQDYWVPAGVYVIFSANPEGAWRFIEQGSGYPGMNINELTLADEVVPAFNKGDRVWHEEFGEGTVIADVWSPSQGRRIAVDVVFDTQPTRAFVQHRFHFYRQEEPGTHYIHELELADEHAINFHKTKKETAMDRIALFNKGDRIFHEEFGYGTVDGFIENITYDIRAAVIIAFDDAEKSPYYEYFYYPGREVPNFGRVEELQLVPAETSSSFKKRDRVYHEVFGEGSVVALISGRADNRLIAIEVLFNRDVLKRFYVDQQETIGENYIEELELMDERAVKYHEVHSFEVDDRVYHPVFGEGKVTVYFNDVAHVKFDKQINPVRFFDDRFLHCYEDTKYNSSGLHLLSELTPINSDKPDFTKANEQMSAEIDGRIDELSKESLIGAPTLQALFNEEEQMTTDIVNKPAHYTATKIEPIDVIETWGLGFHLGNTVKYIARHGKKDPNKTLEDLKKARWYLDRYIKQLEESSKVSE